jgi:hypothetical protein
MSCFYLLLLILPESFSPYTGQWVRYPPLCSHSFLLNLVPVFSSLLYIFYYLTMVETYLFPLHSNSDALLSNLSLVHSLEIAITSLLTVLTNSEFHAPKI